MQSLGQAIQAGHAAYQRGALDEARRLLAPVKHPKAIHLLALVEKSAGNLAGAFALLQRAAKLDRRDPEIANNLALLAHETGQLDLAEAEYRRALKRRPDFPQARSGLGRLLIDLERWPEAIRLHEKLLASAPDNIYVRFGLATALLGDGQAERAEALFDALIEAGNRQPQIFFMRGRARMELGQVDVAIADLRQAHEQNPDNLSLKALGSALWMVGDREAFDALLEDAVAQPALLVSAAEMLRQSGAPDKALEALGNARDPGSMPPESRAIAVSAHNDLKEPGKAESVALACLAVDPDDRGVIRNLVTALLTQGKAADAMPWIEKMRAADPNNQHWIAYEASALRLLGSERYATLVDLERFVRPYRLPVPEGFDSLEEFNAAFLEALGRWHNFRTHPLDQSLRDGSQTPRNLTTIDDPVIKAFYRALDEPIRQYMADVGTGKEHPLTARNTGNYRIAGAWSVRLHGGGRHVNHVHTEGWISSSYYVSVPEESRSGTGKAGWIKFAEPPFETTPPSPPEKWIRPEAGMLVLFPSFLWHGTEAIHDSSVRVTAPFDVVPVQADR
jgi:tetratricopeptide (TPR) repeat protein